MTRTQKRGGFLSDPAGRFVNRDAEIRELRAAAAAITPSMPPSEMKPLAKTFFELMLHSNYAIRNRPFRQLLQAKIDETRTLFPDLNDLITEVQMYKDSIPPSQIMGGKCKTKKYGGFETDESGKFARATTEINILRDALRAVESAPTDIEKAEKAKVVLELLLFSRVAIRNRRFRATVRQKLEQFWDVPEMFEDRRLITQVMEYLNSIPESEIVGGKKRRSTRKTRKMPRHRK
jgi:hypothetical protein